MIQRIHNRFFESLIWIIEHFNRLCIIHGFIDPLFYDISTQIGKCIIYYFGDGADNFRSFNHYIRILNATLRELP